MSAVELTNFLICVWLCLFWGVRFDSFTLFIMLNLNITASYNIVKLQDEIVSASGQVEPPGMHMIYLPYCDDIRPIEEVIYS